MMYQLAPYHSAVQVDFMSVQVLKEPLKRPNNQEPLKVLIAASGTHLTLCALYYII